METGPFAAEIERNSRFNIIVNGVDGFFFWTGYAFLAPFTILPVYVSHFTSNPFLIGLIPFLNTSCYLLPQLFASNWTSRVPRKKFLPVNIGFFSERMPIFLMPVSVALFAVHQPGLALASLLILFGWHATGAGVVMVGWQDMIARVIPMDRRGRFFGFTNFAGTVGGMLSSLAVVWLLANYAFPRGFVLAFTAGAVAIFISWFFLAQTREPAMPSQAPQVSLGQYLKTLPAIIRRDQNFKNLLLAQLVMGLNSMGIGFLIVYVTQRWALPDSQAGVFSFATLVGKAIMYLLVGSLADRKGHKMVLQLFTLITGVFYLLAWLGNSPGWFYPVFLLRGAAYSCSFISGMLIALEFSSPEMRPTYIGLNSTISGVSMAVAPLIGGWLVLAVGYQVLFAITAVVSLAGFGVLHWMVREPREGLAAGE